VSDRKEYFESAASWAADAQLEAARSRRLAWTAAGIAAGIACFEAVALAMLAPLKTVQPITLLVDRQTGYVTSLDPNSPRPVAADEALTQAFLAQYVMAREGFDRATVAADYRKVALWSSGSARSDYLGQMPASNPASPFNRFAPGTVIAARVKSVSKLGEGVALVRFDTLFQDLNGSRNVSQPWIATVRYRYVNAPMSVEDRLVNPLGFQVLSYRRDAEAMTAVADPSSSQPGMSPPSQVLSGSVQADGNGFAASSALASNGPPSPDAHVPQGSPLSPPAGRRAQ